MKKILVTMYATIILGLLSVGAVNIYHAAAQTQNDYVRQTDRNTVEIEGLKRRIENVEALRIDSRISRLEEGQQNNTYLLTAIFIAVIGQLIERIYGLTRKTK